MKNHTIPYFFIVLLIIAIGILSRKTPLIPLFVGDICYAILLFFIVRLLRPKTKTARTALLSLLFCYAIEAFQGVPSEALIPIRKSLFGRYVLGQGFLWSDLLCYTFGVVIAVLLDWVYRNSRLSLVTEK